MGRGLELLRIDGFVVSTQSSSPEVIHGIAAATKDGVTRGVMFGQSGAISTIEAFLVPMEQNLGLVLVCGITEKNQKAVYASNSGSQGSRIADGIHIGTVIADATEMPGFRNGATHIPELMKFVKSAKQASFDRPSLRLEVHTAPWSDVYDTLTVEERAVADVVIWFSLFNVILGPDASRSPHFNFYSAVTFREVQAKNGIHDPMPWSFPSEQ